jgi:uncharacterized protein YqeY
MKKGLKMISAAIAKDSLEARKQYAAELEIKESDHVDVIYLRAKTDLLVTLLSDISNVGKAHNREATDEEALKVITKFLNNTEENIRIYKNHAGSSAQYFVAEQEGEILRDYMIKYAPKKIDEAELSTKVYTLTETFGVEKKAKGAIMKALKDLSNTEGAKFAYDAKLAAEIVDSFLVH